MRLGVVAMALVAGCGLPRAVTVHADICAGRCGSMARAVGDFSGLDCARYARLRVYDAGGDGGDLGAKLSEQCVDIHDPAVYGSLFTITAGVPGAIGVAPKAVILSSGGSSGLVVIEIALMAQGAPPGCVSDGPLVAIGRSPPFDLGGDVSSVAVNLGCHELCLDPQPRSGAIRFRDPTLLADGAAPSSAALGDLFATSAIVSLDGSCDTINQAHVSSRIAVFQSYDPQFLSMGDYTLSGTFGTDTGPQGGCMAVETIVGGTSVYSCLAGTTSPIAYTLTAPQVTQILSVGMRADSMAGPVVLVFVDAQGQAVPGVTIPPSQNAIKAIYVDDQLKPTATSSGIVILGNAVSDSYKAMSGGTTLGFWAGGAAPGTIVVKQVVVE